MAAHLGDVASELDDDKADRVADISGYSFKKRLTIRAAGLGFYWGIQVIGRTMRFEVDGWKHWEQASQDGNIPIYTFWHHCIVPATYFWRRRGIVVMTSQSFDGEYIARFIQRFGYGAARGSSTRRSVGALIEMIRAMRQGRATAFTIDGPKGPRHVAKMGAVLLAKKTGQPILPFTVVTSRVWELSRSWDRFQLPKPFSRAQVRIAAPIFVPPDTSDTALEGKRLELQAALDGLEHQGEQRHAGLSKAG